MEVTLIKATDGKQYANLGKATKQTLKLTGLMVLSYGGIRYKTAEGELIYRNDQAYGNDTQRLEFYQRVVANGLKDFGSELD